MRLDVFSSCHSVGSETKLMAAFTHIYHGETSVHTSVKRAISMVNLLHVWKNERAGEEKEDIFKSNNE